MRAHVSMALCAALAAMACHARHATVTTPDARPPVTLLEPVDERRHAPPAASAPDASAAVCDGRTARGGHVHQLLRCPDALVDAVRGWRPDALVALGGGILGPGRAACSTVQRAKATAQLFEALDRAPWMVLSGEGPHEPARALDGIEARCVRARLTQERAHPDAPVAEIAREATALDRTNTAALTEADYLCAAIVAAHDDDAWRDAVFARMLFEPRSETTVENALRASVILKRRSLRRVVIVTTPVMRDGREVDNHARRALGDFEADRARGLHDSRLGAVSCPDGDGAAPWSGFERDPH